MTILRFPNVTNAKMIGLSLKQSDIYDVYNYGEHLKHLAEGRAMSKFYSDYGYEIGLFYAIDKRTGEVIITHVWKRERHG